MIEEYDDEDELTKELTYASYIDEAVTLTVVGVETYTDHHQLDFSTSALTDASGAVAELVTYSDTGSARFVDGDNQAQAAQVPASITLFQGRALDPEAGLLHYRHRYYGENEGRFLSRDPLEVLTRSRCCDAPSLAEI